MPPDAEPIAVSGRGWLRSASLGYAVVLLASAEQLGLELWLFLVGMGDIIRIVLVAGLLWAVWSGRTWARITDAALSLLGGAIVLNSGAGYSVPLGWLGVVSIVLGLALLLVPGVGAFQAGRRQRVHGGG